MAINTVTQAGSAGGDRNNASIVQQQHCTAAALYGSSILQQQHMRLHACTV
jgi:hypothetical protein